MSSIFWMKSAAQASKHLSYTKAYYENARAACNKGVRQK